MGPEDFGLEPNHKTWKIERFAIMKLSKDNIEPDEQNCRGHLLGYAMKLPRIPKSPFPRNLRSATAF
jgi:hypothetical protein